MAFPPISHWVANTGRERDKQLYGAVITIVAAQTDAIGQGSSSHAATAAALLLHLEEHLITETGCGAQRVTFLRHGTIGPIHIIACGGCGAIRAILAAAAATAA